MLQCLLKTLKYQNLVNVKKQNHKAPFFIYVDLEYIIEKIDGCKNNPEKPFPKKVGEHIPLGKHIRFLNAIR